jgi:L-arabinonolactonase
MQRIDVVIDLKTELGEGPLWDMEFQRLFWIDSKGGKVFRTTAEGAEVRAWEVPGEIGSMAIRKDGLGAVVALDKGLHLLDFKTGDVELIEDPEPGMDQNRLIKTKVVPQAAFSHLTQISRFVSSTRT